MQFNFISKALIGVLSAGLVSTIVTAQTASPGSSPVPRTHGTMDQAEPNNTTDSMGTGTTTGTGTMTSPTAHPTAKPIHRKK